MTTADKTIDNGGPAFSVCFEGGQNNGDQPYFHEGMSLRDWFAGQALAGIFSSRWYSDHVKDLHKIMDVRDQYIGASKTAYAAADAMIAARKGGAA